MSTSHEVELADLSLAGALRHFAEHSPAGAVEQHDGILLFAGGHHYPGAYCNGALRLDRGVEPAKLVQAAGSFFAPRRRGYAVWIRDQIDADLEAHVRDLGFFQRPPPEGMPGMVLSEPLAGVPPQLLPGARVERVRDLPMARRYLAVVAEAYGMEQAPPELASGVFFEPGSALGENVCTVLATLDGRPAAGAMTIVLDGVGGLYWVATAPWARGRGLGVACATAATRGGFELGAHMAALQASQLGTRMWQSLGFREVTRYRRFLAPPARQG